MYKDTMGKELQVGDIIAYATQTGRSKVELRITTITSIDNKSIKVADSYSGIASTSSKVLFLRR